MRSRASQKVGTAKPMKTMTAVTRSKSESCRTAETTPSGIATSRATPVTVRVPAEAAPGDYAGTLTINGDTGSTFYFNGPSVSNALYVDDGGRVGLGTNTPVLDIHNKRGNTPSLRLEQDGSSGFTAQTWDVAGIRGSGSDTVRASGSMPSWIRKAAGRSGRKSCRSMPSSSRTARSTRHG